MNTASIAGLTSGPRGAIYGSSKHAVVRVTEALYLQLQERAPQVGVTLLCPGRILTRIGVAERNRPQPLLGDASQPSNEEIARREREWVERPFKRLAPADVAQQLLDAVRERQFYVLTPDVDDTRIRQRMDAILARHNPEPEGR